MYMNTENFQYLEEISKLYNPEQRKRFRTEIFCLLLNRGCRDMSQLTVAYKELVRVQPREEVITRWMIKKVHRQIMNTKG